MVLNEILNNEGFSLIRKRGERTIFQVREFVRVCVGSEIIMSILGMRSRATNLGWGRG